jgi:hypothetical protein
LDIRDQDGNAYPADALTISAQNGGGFERYASVAILQGQQAIVLHAGVAQISVALKADPTISAQFTIVSPGDIDRNGAVNSRDLNQVTLYFATRGWPGALRQRLGIKIDSYTARLCDMNRDGNVNNSDLRALLGYLSSGGRSTASLR